MNPMIMTFLLISPASLALPAMEPFHDQTPEWRDPITILSDEGFSQENGVARGSGTPTDPFVIEDYVIVYLNQSGHESAVTIKNTRAHLVIQNLTVTGILPNDLADSPGVFLQNVTHVTVKGIYVPLPWTGVRVHDSAHVEVKDSIFEADRRNTVFNLGISGVAGHSNEDWTISGNHFIGLALPVAISSSDGVIVKNNLIEDSKPLGAGISVRASSNVVLESNLIERSAAIGINLHESEDLLALDNTIREGSNSGFRVSGGANIIIHSNRLSSLTRGVDMEGASVTFSCNTLKDLPSGGWFKWGGAYEIIHNEWTDSGAVEAHDSAVFRNNSLEVVLDSDGLPLDARYNWWGSHDGPGPGQTGPEVDFIPWLEEPPSSCK